MEDTDTMFAGIEEAMARCEGIVFVSTGGPVFDGDGAHRSFWARARGSRFAARFEDRGRVTRAEALDVLGGCHVALSIARRSLEAELGSRQRWSRPRPLGGRWSSTGPLGDLARANRRWKKSRGHRSAGDTPPPCRGALSVSHGPRGPGLARPQTRGLVAGRANRRRQRRRSGNGWPALALGPRERGRGAGAIEQRLLKVQSELDHIRQRRTFRACAPAGPVARARPVSDRRSWEPWASGAVVASTSSPAHGS